MTESTNMTLLDQVTEWARERPAHTLLLKTNPRELQTEAGRCSSVFLKNKSRCLLPHLLSLLLPMQASCEGNAGRLVNKLWCWPRGKWALVLDTADSLLLMDSSPFWVLGYEWDGLWAPKMWMLKSRPHRTQHWWCKAKMEVNYRCLIQI